MYGLCKALVALPLCLLAADAAAMTTLTFDWIDIRCGVIAADGTTTASPCLDDRPSFSARVQPGEAAFVTATLSYTYHDDGLALGRTEGFQMDASGFQMRYFDYEAAGLYFRTSACVDRYCRPPPHWTESFSGPQALLLGDNAVPDDLTGRLDFSATAGVEASFFGADNRTSSFDVGFVRTFSPVNAIPEPSTYALLLAGLLFAGVLNRRRAAVALLAASAASAHAETTLTWLWSGVGCGLIAANGTRTERPCDGRSFSALVMPGESVFVAATLRYQYSDDGLPLDPGATWGFITGGGGSFRRVTHEAGALYFYSNQCSTFQECMSRPVEQVDTFNGPVGPLILGDNDVPDNLSGEFGLFATSGQLATWPGGAVRTARIDVQGLGLSGIAPAIPEPATYALMLAGLAALGRAKRRHH